MQPFATTQVVAFILDGVASRMDAKTPSTYLSAHIRRLIFLSRYSASLCLLLLLTGCATSSLFTPYPQQAEAYRQAASSDNYDHIAKQLEKRTQGKDKLLYLQERGRIAQIQGDTTQSRQDFAAAIKLYDENDQAARIRLGETGSAVGSLMVNDNALAYRGQDYERIMLHSFQALNYWQDKDFEGAAVEFRRATLEQNIAKQKRDKEIAKAQEEARKNEVKTNQLEQQLGGLDTAAASVRNSIENAYAYYLAGVFREGTGDYNNALVDYKRAYEINPGLKLLPSDIQRVEQKQRGQRNDNADIVIAYEQGFIPPRESFDLPIPTIHGYFAVSIPTYPGFSPVSPPLRVSGAQQHTETQVAAQLNAMAARALKEQLTAMLVRQTLRATLKYETQKQANDNLGLLGAFSAQIYNLVSEQADLRSWLTLPASAQVARFNVPAGEHKLQLSGPRGNAQVTINAKARSTTLIRVVDGYGQLHTTVMPTLEVIP